MSVLSPPSFIFFKQNAIPNHAVSQTNLMGCTAQSNRGIHELFIFTVGSPVGKCMCQM